MTSCDTTPLLAYDDALERLTAAVSPLGSVIELELRETLGRVLACNLDAEIDVPGCAMSAMDGYAINTSEVDASAEVCLPVSQRIPAGVAADDLVPGTAARIFTGAPIPKGANAVVMQEHVTAQDQDIRIHQVPTACANVRPAGNDIKRGSRILQQGCRLRAQDIGLAASVGRRTLPVFTKVKVGMFFTGDELVEPGSALAPHKIYDSNRYTLHGLLESMGCEVVDLGLVGDSLAATRESMLAAASQSDLVVTSGGVSVGEEDHVRAAIEQLGELQLSRVAIKPGKPVAFGRINSTPFIGLPGNPVSVFATFCLFVCPLIQIMQGRRWRKPIALPVIADFNWAKPDSRREFLRARLATDSGGRTVVQIYPNQDSGVLTSTVWADGFVELGENQRVHVGDNVNFLHFAQFFNG